MKSLVGFKLKFGRDGDEGRGRGRETREIEEGKGGLVEGADWFLV